MIGKHFWCLMKHRATHVMKHNIDTNLAFLGKMIASCRTFSTLGLNTDMIVDPSKGEFRHSQE